MFNAISHQKNANENHNQYQYNLTGVAKIKINDNTGCLGEEEAGKGHMWSLCITFYKCMWTYNYLSKNVNEKNHEVITSLWFDRHLLMSLWDLTKPVTAGKGASLQGWKMDLIQLRVNETHQIVKPPSSPTKSASVDNLPAIPISS